MTRWLITGAGGMLGAELAAKLPEAVALTRYDLDLLDAAAATAVIDKHRPQIVVNCAAWTAVDYAESHEIEALAVNGTAVGRLTAACREVGARLVHLSTDYVFGGDAAEPYPEDAPVDPVNAYGRTKLAGEQAVLSYELGYVLRTAWLYGAHGPNFVRTMIRLAGERDTVEVVDDQRGQPTWTGDLADQIIALMAADEEPGVYHGTNRGETTWYHLTREIFTLLGTDPDRVRPTTTDAFPRPAPRPAYSVLAQTRGPAMRDWKAALHAAWPELTEASEAPRST